MTLSATTVDLLVSQGLDPDGLQRQVHQALAEDLAYGPDITTLATVPSTQRVRAQVAARQPGVLCGVAVARAVLDTVVEPDRWQCLSMAADGDQLRPGDVALEVESPTQELLTAERTALNFMGHLSGVATMTARWVAAVAGTGVMVRDTRKTTPGLRVLGKYAVRCGGGANHRMGLGDAALVKDNHVAAAGGVIEAVKAIRALDPKIPLEVECDSLSQVEEAIDAGVAVVLLDNMTTGQLTAAVELARRGDGSVKLEASGGLRLDTVHRVAATGVDFVAVGALTHSAPVLDLGLDVVDVIGRVGR